MGLIRDGIDKKKKEEEELDLNETDPENPYGDDEDQDVLSKLLNAKKKRGKAKMVEVND